MAVKMMKSKLLKCKTRKILLVNKSRDKRNPCFQKIFVEKHVEAETLRAPLTPHRIYKNNFKQDN